tara:strand:- start:543 stop:707 length:165 start_codon:yes stop_codon:yes gene_type:complete
MKGRNEGRKRVSLFVLWRVCPSPKTKDGPNGNFSLLPFKKDLFPNELLHLNECI